MQVRDLIEALSRFEPSDDVEFRIKEKANDPYPAHTKDCEVNSFGHPVITVYDC